MYDKNEVIDMLKIAMVGVWHVHAEGYANQINNSGKAKVTCVWDNDIGRGRDFAEKFSCTFFENYDELLSSDIDAIAVCSSTDIHREVITKAAKAKKHIFTEKVLALKNGDACAIADAIKENGVKFVISYSHIPGNAVQCVKEIVSSGKLGTVTYARMRNTHSGSVDNWLPEHFYNLKECGGGAMIDLGAHPMYILAWLLGKPVSVSSVFTEITGHGVEDNAVSVLRFPDGAIGVSETGFVSRSDRNGIEVSGTDGFVRQTGNDVFIALKAKDNQWEKVEIEEKNMPSPLSYFIGILSGEEDKNLYNIDDAVLLTEIMEAAYKSHKEKREVEL